MYAFGWRLAAYLSAVELSTWMYLVGTLPERPYSACLLSSYILRVGPVIDKVGCPNSPLLGGFYRHAAILRVLPSPFRRWSTAFSVLIVPSRLCSWRAWWAAFCRPVESACGRNWPRRALLSLIGALGALARSQVRSRSGRRGAQWFSSQGISASPERHCARC